MESITTNEDCDLIHKIAEMDKKRSNDPRSLRARKAINQALKDLMKVMPYGKITITDITRQAGFARHTFYNHYDTKEDLLNSFIDSILDDLFSEIGQWDIMSKNNIEGIRIFMIHFFGIWRDHTEVVKILMSVDFDCLLIDRLKTHFTNYYYEYGNQEITGVGIEMARYLINFNAYSFAGILRQWFKDDMKYSPEVMGQFLDHFAGKAQADTAIEKFRDVIR